MAQRTQSPNLRADRRSLEGDPVAVKLVLRELLDVNTGLTVQELRERTLLPEATLQQILTELAAAGLCSRHQRPHHDHQRFVVEYPPDGGV